MSTGNRREAFGAYYFTVQIQGQNHLENMFRSCSGLKSESEVIELAEGGLNDTTHKLIGRTKFPNIVLKVGFAGKSLWDLRKQSEAGKKRFSGAIIQLGPNGQKAKWTFKQGWICKWEGPDFDAGKNEISIESIEIAHEGLDLVQVK
jgi:phage tail-like protein